MRRFRIFNYTLRFSEFHPCKLEHIFPLSMLVFCAQIYRLNLPFGLLLWHCILQPSSETFHFSPPLSMLAINKTRCFNQFGNLFQQLIEEHFSTSEKSIAPQTTNKIIKHFILVKRSVESYFLLKMLIFNPTVEFLLITSEVLIIVFIRRMFNDIDHKTI